MNEFKELKDKYNEGFRCIYTEKDEDNGLTMHLKNFREEKIHTIHAKGDMEIGQIEDYLDQLNKLKKRTGHDCHNL